MINEERRGEQYARLSQLGDYEVSTEDPDPRGWSVVDRSGRPLGRVEDLIVDPGAMKVRYLDTHVSASGGASARARIPVERVELDHARNHVVADFGPQELASFVGGDYAAGVQGDDMAGARDAAMDPDAMAGEDDGRTRLTRAEEEVSVHTRPVPAGEVVVGKHVETERVTTPVARRVERVRIERRPVTGATTGSPELREGEIRVPVMEEEVAVTKRPVVKEEIVVTREADTEMTQVETDVRREQVHVSGDDALIAEDETARKHRAGGGNRG